MKSLIFWAILFLSATLYRCSFNNDKQKGYDQLSYFQPDGFRDSLLIGSFPVYENRETQKGRKINLFVAITPALVSDSVMEPIFIIEGGPGAAASNAAYFYSEIEQSYRTYHDIVYLDVRGTGNSEPLHCPEIQSKSTPQEYFDHPYPEKKLGMCIKRYADSVDFNMYNTKYMVEDIEEVRQWLGYGKINLLGTSFGGKVSLMYMERYPASINRVVLHAPDAPNIDYVSKRGRYSQRALDELFNVCEKDSLCFSSYPNIRNEFDALMNRIKKERITQHINWNGESYEIELSWLPIAAKIANMLYNDSEYIEIPYYVHEAYLENYMPLMEGMNITNTDTSYHIADGLWLSNICSEDIPNVALNDEEAEKSSFLSDYTYITRKYACDQWPVYPVDLSSFSAVVSDIPTLLISGNLDPVLPPETGIEIVSNLSNSQHIIVPYMTHMLGDLSNIGCYDNYIVNYFNNNIDELNVECFQKMKPRAFRLPDQEEKVL